MYTGRLLDDTKPAAVYMDPFNKYMDSSWESLYLLAHRFDIHELTDIARAFLLSKLSPRKSIPFLFRTAYLFTDLRKPVIKYAAQSCSSIRSSKSVRRTYSDHPAVTTIHPYQFKASDEPFAVRFTLSSMDVTVPPADYADATPTLGEVILEKLYKDETHEDIFFVFDSVPETSTTTGDPEVNTGIKSDSSTDATVSVEYERDSSMNPGNSDGDTYRLKRDTIRSRDSGLVTIGAHKLILCQWSYFKAMFEGGFVEGGAGNKEVRIKDASPKAFLQLLRFMYTGRLPDDVKPRTVYMDALNRCTDASWESLYLLADRYKVEELIVIARAKILSKFNSEETVPFLFRTAYLFVDLREPVIKYMVDSCGSIIASKSTRLDYVDHPDGVQIFGELFEQLYAIRN
ncbi:hypothetical protein BG000_006156 [Podila horticola]|nr:hypothetical protein BG000_006156 [Podila horticola]